MRTTRLRVTLTDVDPRVLRVLDVPADVTLPDLHDLLQAAMGWADFHLHEYVAADHRWTSFHDSDAVDPGSDDEAGVRLRDLDALRFTYRYDFGDDWEHTVEILGPGAEEPGLRYGEGACPPEDCGGPAGYARLREVLDDPRHPEHDKLRDWLGGDLTDFDADHAARRVTEALGSVPATVRLLLELIGDGVTLTPGGRLPRVIVRQMQDLRPLWHPSGAPAMREEDLNPLVALHDLLRSVGLVRLTKGVLRPTRAALAGDTEIVRRLRTRFPRPEPTTTLAGMAIGRLLAHGPATADQLAVRIHADLDWPWTYAGRPMGVEDLRWILRDAGREWTALDLVVDDHLTWHAGLSARTLLPSVPIISDFLAR